MKSEKRQKPRFKCTGIASVQVFGEMKDYAGKIENLSAGGCLIKLREPADIPVDTKVELTFDVNHLPFRVQAVVRVSRGDKSLGFQFVSVSPRKSRQIEDLIDELNDMALPKCR